MAVNESLGRQTTVYPEHNFLSGVPMLSLTSAGTPYILNHVIVV